MTLRKDNSMDNMSLKHAVEWCSLVGIDEVIQETPFNHLIVKEIAESEIANDSSVPHTAVNKKDLSFDSCTNLEDLKLAVQKTDEYLSLSKTASHMLFGKGPENARIMVIAEKPGREEDISNELFSGKNAQIIHSITNSAGFKSDDIYYTYLSKWRPPGGRKLSETEQENLSILLKKQLNLISPQIIVTLGETTLYALVPKTNFNFRKNVGKLVNIENKSLGKKNTFLALFHEESLLKTPQLKKAIWLSIVNCKGDLIRQ